MSVSVISQNLKTGTCPHGLPLGACPICNGMCGGGARQKPIETKKTDAPEWSFMRCYMEGKMLAANKPNNIIQAQMIDKLTFAQSLAQNVKVLVQNVQNVLQNISNALPPSLQGVFNKVVNNVITPLLNLIQKLPQIAARVEKFIADIKTQILNVMDKLTALLGELKNFVEEKFKKQFKKVAKKFLKLFIWDDGEKTGETDEELEIFKSRELRKVKNAILHLTKKGEDDEHHSH